MNDIKQAIMELRETIWACIDSLEYVDSLPGIISGYGVRKERIIKAKRSLAALTDLESTVERGTMNLTSRIQAAAEEIAKQADEVWPSLRCDNCGSFVLLRNIPEDGYDCQGCSNFTRTPDEVIGITKNDLEKLSTAIITRYIEGGGK